MRVEAPMSLWPTLRRLLSAPDLPDHQEHRVASTLKVVVWASLERAVGG
jgi:hypothetical protein